ncbi:hypothetical protein Vafri_11899 [Volvox africanus]|uniref:cyclin-dependent kinase n=1 Tax=Volvox africanus TaxID=51714 RepID=A0A8J4B8J5_9CHLO|nr:hypothetical protein Vafri_11899 [Volvox africanus]
MRRTYVREHTFDVYCEATKLDQASTFMEEYEYLTTVDEGAYGFVWKCVERATGRHVAIKGFKQAHEEPEIMRLAVREARVLQTLKHPAIIQLVEAFKSKSGRVYMVFPYGGLSAYQELEKHPDGFPDAQLKLLVWQLLQALVYLHRRKIVHRDIKPGNILVSEDWELKLCDFGFARATNSGPRDVERLTSYVVTRWYRAPGKSTADQLCIIMQCFGRLSESQMALLYSSHHLAQLELPAVRRSVRDHLKRCDPDLVRLVESCLQLDPRQRPTATELLHAPYLSGVPGMMVGTPLEQVYSGLIQPQQQQSPDSTVGDIKPQCSQCAAAAGDCSLVAPQRPYGATEQLPRQLIPSYETRKALKRSWGGDGEEWNNAGSGSKEYNRSSKDVREEAEGLGQTEEEEDRSSISSSSGAMSRVVVQRQQQQRYQQQWRRQRQHNLRWSGEVQQRPPQTQPLYSTQLHAHQGTALDVSAGDMRPLVRIADSLGPPHLECMPPPPPPPPGPNNGEVTTEISAAAPLVIIVPPTPTRNSMPPPRYQRSGQRSDSIRAAGQSAAPNSCITTTGAGPAAALPVAAVATARLMSNQLSSHAFACIPTITTTTATDARVKCSCGLWPHPRIRNTISHERRKEDVLLDEPITGGDLPAGTLDRSSPITLPMHASDDEDDRDNEGDNSCLTIHSGPAAAGPAATTATATSSAGPTEVAAAVHTVVARAALTASSGWNETEVVTGISKHTSSAWGDSVTLLPQRLNHLDRGNISLTEGRLKRRSQQRLLPGRQQQHLGLQQQAQEEVPPLLLPTFSDVPAATTVRRQRDLQPSSVTTVRSLQAVMSQQLHPSMPHEPPPSSLPTIAGGIRPSSSLPLSAGWWVLPTHGGRGTTSTTAAWTNYNLTAPAVTATMSAAVMPSGKKPFNPSGGSTVSSVQLQATPQPSVAMMVPGLSGEGWSPSSAALVPRASCASHGMVIHAWAEMDVPTACAVAAVTAPCVCGSTTTAAAAAAAATRERMSNSAAARMDSSSSSAPGGSGARPESSSLEASTTSQKPPKYHHWPAQGDCGSKHSAPAVGPSCGDSSNDDNAVQEGQWGNIVTKVISKKAAALMKLFGAFKKALLGAKAAAAAASRKQPAS